MLSNIQKAIIVRAIRIRLGRGEALDAVLESYPRLTENEKAEIRAEFTTD